MFWVNDHELVDLGDVAIPCTNEIIISLAKGKKKGVYNDVHNTVRIDCNRVTAG